MQGCVYLWLQVLSRFQNPGPGACNRHSRFERPLDSVWGLLSQILVIMVLLVRIITPWPALAGFVATCTMVPASAWIFSKVSLSKWFHSHCELFC